MNDAACRFYLVRHGETEWNARGIIQGQSDSPLTAVGEEQARLLALQLRDVPFDVAFSSDLGRAMRTAEIIVRGRGLPVRTTPLLRERRFGRYEGQPREALPPPHAGSSAADQRGYGTAPDIESDEAMEARLLTFLRETARVWRGRTVLAVAHGGLMRVALTHLSPSVSGTLSHAPIANGARIVLRSDGEETTVERTVGIAQPGQTPNDDG